MESASNVVVDTAALYALVVRNDEFHETAHREYRQLIDSETRLFTTSYVLVETHALLARRFGMESIRTLTETIEGIVRPIWVGQTLHERAWTRFADRGGSGLSLVDWTVVLAAQGQEASVFTFDGGFAKEGVSAFPETRR